MNSGPIVVHGAGSIGAFAGGAWRLGGADVRLLGRRWLADAIASDGLSLSDYAGRTQSIAAADIPVATDPAILSQASLVVLAIKATALETAIGELLQHCPPGTPILALQNGLGPLERLRERLPDHRVIGGIVTHNVAHLRGARFHKGTAGHIVTERNAALDPLAAASQGGFDVIEQVDDFVAVRWGKLLINLNNAANAVTGLGLRAHWLDRRGRATTAAAIREGLRVAHAMNIRPGKSGAISPQGLARLLSLPQWLFVRMPLLAKIDARARTSMADDIAAGRPTEIAFLNGAIARLGREHGIATPVNDDLVARIGAIDALASHSG